MPVPPAGVPAFIGSAVATLIFVVAAAVYIAQQLKPLAPQLDNIAHALTRAGVSVRGVGGASLAGHGTIPSRPAVGGGALAVPVPGYNQLTDVTVSNAPAWTGPVDCGPECVAAGLYAVRGVETVAELLRLRAFGVIDSRLTTASDLANMYRINNVKTQIIAPSSNDLVHRLGMAAEAGHPIHVLGNWLSAAIGHWHTVIRVGDSVVTVRDPWGGVTRQYDLGVYLGLYSGSALEVLESARY